MATSRDWTPTAKTTNVSCSGTLQPSEWSESTVIDVGCIMCLKNRVSRAASGADASSFDDELLVGLIDPTRTRWLGNPWEWTGSAGSGSQRSLRGLGAAGDRALEQLTHPLAVDHAPSSLRAAKLILMVDTCRTMELGNHDQIPAHDALHAGLQRRHQRATSTTPAPQP